MNNLCLSGNIFLMGKTFNIKNRDRVVKTGSGIEFSQVSNHWLFKLVSLGISTVIFFTVFNSTKITIQKLEILKKAEQEVEDLRLTNLHLSIGIKDMSTDRYLEKEARDRLNFGGDNEIVFVIPENTIEIAKEEVDKIVNPKVESIYEESGNNLNEWVEFVMAGV